MNELSRLIADEIRTRGAIPFARFMELAMYAPGLGYYERALDQIGRAGDFYTSVSVGPLFGELLAFQFTRWIEELAKSGNAHIVEAGAHNGRLAHDILSALHADHRDLLPRVQYLIIEPSRTRRDAQQRLLSGFSGVQWLEHMPATGTVNGVVFSNELLDAMPVHRLAWNAAARRWDELGVALVDQAFTWTRLPLSVAPPPLPNELLDVLPDGYVVECSPAAKAWWQQAAGALGSGKLVAIDYGGVIEELLNPSRSRGTLRAYSRHRVTDDLLAAPGEQDITAHVNFSDIGRAGEVAGLTTEVFTTQSQFLTQIAREMWQARGSWPHEHVRQFQTLTHPEHLGRPFRVLVQARRRDATAV